MPVALLLIDLDDLKVVNDGEGHPAGDRLLVGMANSIRDALRYGDRGFRIGGDEFAVILPHTEAPDALIAANRLRHFCLRPAAGERAIPFSGGISSVPLLAADRGELFRQADAALYRCKRNGRGTVAVFDADRDQVPGRLRRPGCHRGHPRRHPGSRADACLPAHRRPARRSRARLRGPHPAGSLDALQQPRPALRGGRGGGPHSWSWTWPASRS